VRDRSGALLTGVLLGFSLSRIGFSSWDEVHRMFVFEDLRMFLAFASGVTALGLFWWGARSLSKHPIQWPSRLIHRGTFWGSAAFGTGWALGGACPGIVFVQLGEGQLGALWTLGGIVLGNTLYSFVHERWFTWAPQSCAEN
jgi:uncharacterized membrane protein YedE/YeeE